MSICKKEWASHMAWKFYFAMLPAIVLLPGCGCRVIDWAKSSFNQGCLLPDCYSQAHCYVRSLSLYDQFETVAIFDALLISRKVLAAYADLWACKNGKHDEQKQNLLDSLVTEHEPYISFYLLSLYDGTELGSQESIWSVLLDVDGHLYNPVEFKAVELTPYYQLFFGSVYTRFKVSYRLRFSAEDSAGNRIITAKTKRISLIFRSCEKVGVMSWDFEHGKEGSITINNQKPLYLAHNIDSVRPEERALRSVYAKASPDTVSRRMAESAGARKGVSNNDGAESDCIGATKVGFEGIKWPFRPFETA